MLSGLTALCLAPQTVLAQTQTATGSPPRPAHPHGLVSLRAVQTDQPVVALTFDDGPHPAHTPVLLDILAARRVRASVAALRAYAGYSSALSIEVGARVKPVARDTVPTCPEESWWGNRADDDLWQTMKPKWYAQHYAEGEVLHLYVYDRTELTDVATVWSGYGDAAPVVIDFNGRWVADHVAGG